MAEQLTSKLLVRQIESLFLKGRPNHI